MLKCETCGFEHGVLVRSVPYFGFMCFSCFKRVFDELQDLLFQWEDEVIEDLKTIVRTKLENGETPGAIYREYPCYVMEDVFIYLRDDDTLSEDIRSAIVDFLYSEEYFRIMDERVRCDYFKRFARDVKGLFKMTPDKMKMIIENLSTVWDDWYFRIDKFFFHEIVTSYEDRDRLLRLLEVYKDYLVELRDVVMDVLSQAPREEHTPIHECLGEFLNHIQAAISR